MSIRHALSFGAAAFMSAAAFAQLPVAPSHHHLERLEPLMESNWETTMSAPQGDVRATYAFDWDANEAFVLFTHDISIGDETHTEHGMIGWDPVEDKLRFWGFLADGSFFDGYEVDAKEGEFIAFNVNFTGSQYMDRARITMAFSTDDVMTYGIQMLHDENWSEIIERPFRRVPKPGSETSKAATDTINGYPVSVRDEEARPILSIRTTCRMDQISQTLGSLYGQIGVYMGRSGAQFAGQPLAIYHEYDPNKNEVDLEAAIPVNKTVKGNDRISFTHTPAGDTAVLEFSGPYEELQKGHDAMDAFLKKHGFEKNGPPWEVYITDPTTQPDPSKWRTDIHYPVKKVNFPMR